MSLELANDYRQDMIGTGTPAPPDVGAAFKLGRLRTFARTLRFRVAAFNALVIILTALVVLVGLRAGVRLAMLHELDAILTEDLAEVSFALVDAGVSQELLRRGAEGGPNVVALLSALERKARGHEQHGWFVRIFDNFEKLVWASDRETLETTGTRPWRSLGPRTLEGVRLVQSRPTSPPGSLPPDGEFTLQVGASTALVTREMERIDRLVAVSVALVLVSAPAIGYWLAGRVIDPVAEIIGTTSRLHPDRLDERLPVRNTRDELDQLSHTINGLLNRIAKHLEHRQDFLANAAHELRTPLAAIRSTVEVALNSNRSQEEYQERLADVIEECTQLEVLVGQLLLLAEAESDGMLASGQRVDLSALTSKALTMFQAIAENRDLVLDDRITPGVYVEGNSHHLRHVANNLLDNALKFTPSGGRVTISLARIDSQAVLRVTDTGPGIPPADLPYVFDRFFRGDRARRHQGAPGGTGLGLSIGQAVAKAHGGRIFAESGPAGGTTITLRLPLPTHHASGIAGRRCPTAVAQRSGSNPVAPFSLR